MSALQHSSALASHVDDSSMLKPNTLVHMTLARCTAAAHHPHKSRATTDEYYQARTRHRAPYCKLPAQGAHKRTSGYTDPRGGAGGNPGDAKG